MFDELLSIKKEWYFHTYADKNIIINANFKELIKLDDIFFADILQGYICKLFYTYYGKKYKLPIEYCFNLKNYNFKTEKKLRKAFLCKAYEKGCSHMIVSNFNYNRYELINYEHGKYYPSPVLMNYFSYFSTEMYYQAFEHIEISEMERKMRKYLNSRKNYVASKDMKWIINKIKNIKERQSRFEFFYSEEGKNRIEHLNGWTEYWNGVKTGNDFINYPEYTNRFLKMYEQYLDYLTSIGSVQNNQIILIVTIATFIATIIGIIVSLFNFIPLKL